MNLDDRSLILLLVQLFTLGVVGCFMLPLVKRAALRTWLIRSTLIEVVALVVLSQLPAAHALPAHRPLLLPTQVDAMPVVNQKIHSVPTLPVPPRGRARIVARATSALANSPQISVFDIWEAGVVLGAVWIVLSLFAVRGLRRKGEALASYNGLRVYRSKSASSPLVAGVVKPSIFVPDQLAQELSEEEMQTVLAHEYAHVEHQDLRWKLLHRLICAALWPCIPLWVLLHPHDRAMEEAADAKAALALPSPEHYAETLLLVAKKRRGRDAALALSMARRRSNIGNRIKRILQGNMRREIAPLKGGLKVMGGLASLVFVGLLMVGFGWQQAKKDYNKYPWQKPDGTIKFHIFGPGKTEVQNPQAWLRLESLDHASEYRSVDVKDGWVDVDLGKLADFESIRLVAKDAAGNIGSAYPASSDTTELVLGPTTTATGTLIKPDGSPESNAVVRVDSCTLSTKLVDNRPVTVAVLLGENSPLIATAQTDAHGVFTLQGVPKNSIMQISISDTAYQQPMKAVKRKNFTSFGFEIGGEPTDLGRIDLQPAGRVAGRVTLAGKGLAGIRVAAQMINDDLTKDMDGEHRESSWAEAITDNDGNYEIGGLGNARYNIGLFVPKDLARDYAVRAIDSLSVMRGISVREENFELKPGGIIEGDVVLNGNPDPAGYPIGYYGPDHPRSGAWCGQAVCDSRGHFRFRVSPGKQFVYLAMGDGIKGQEVTVEDGQTVHLTLKE